MKKIISAVLALGLVLAVGSVYAYGDMSAAPQKTINGLTPLGNGISFTEIHNTAIQCSAEGGSAGGGMEAAGPAKPFSKVGDMVSYNGVSFSSVPSGPGCSWARGLGREMSIDNGVSFPGR